jgi:hypothetical protein
MFPLIVKSAAEVPSSATVKDMVAPTKTGQEIVAPLVPVPELFTVTFPLRVNTYKPSMVEPVVAPPYIVKLAIVWSASMWTVTLALTVIISAGSEGGPAPPQVAVLLQLPVATAVYVPANTGKVLARKNTNKKRKINFFITSFL